MTARPQNDGLDIIFYATQEAAYADLLGGNLDVLDSVPDSALATFESDLGDRAVNQAAAIFQSFTIPDRLAHFGGEEGKLRRAAISMAINRDEITDVIFQGTRTPATDFTSPVIDGYSDALPGCRGARVQRRRGEGGRGRKPTPSPRGTAPSPSRTTPMADMPDGSTLSPTRSRTPSESTRWALPTRRSPRLAR